MVLGADKGYGLQISAGFVRKDGQIVLELTLFNQSVAPINQVAILFNKNRYIVVSVVLSC